jgi:hypothetical protein
MTPLSREERFLFTFQRKKIDKLSFSPRLYYWYSKNKTIIRQRSFKKSDLIPNENSIPEIYLNKSQEEIYDILGATIRYVLESCNIPLYSHSYVPNILKTRIFYKSLEDGGNILRFKTKYGTLIQKTVSAGGGMSGVINEFFVKTLDDLKNLKYIIENSRYFIFRPFIKYAEHKLKNKAVVSTFLPRSPYQRCILEFLGFKQTQIFLKCYPNEMEDFMDFLGNFDNKLYRDFCRTSIKIFNFGENLDANLTPPHIFKKFCIPYYEKRVHELHQAGKFCHVHMDGDFKDLLPFISDLPFDGLEALTFKPQGDVEIDEVKEALGNKILLDGIPSILFLHQYSMEYVKAYTKKVLETFSPNLILGISDEMPPNGDIRKVEMISKMVQEFEP